MPTQGPIPAEITIVVDWYDPGRGFNLGPVLEKLGRLGIVTNSIFLTSLLNSPPPKVKGDPSIDEYISTRKTCPGSDWVKVGNLWLHSILNDGFLTVRKQLHEIAPKLVILAGKASLVCFTGNTDLVSWRGSRIQHPDYPYTLVPVYHPRVLVKQPDVRWILYRDVERAYDIYTHKQVPKGYNFKIRPTFEQVKNELAKLALFASIERDKGQILTLSGDLETRSGHISCFGIAWSETEAICIPFLHINDSENPFYWSLEEEAQIIQWCIRLFVHPAIKWIGQNFLYDCQHFERHWGARPLNVRDTMIGHHALHSNIKKGLDFLSSVYADDHIYWKDEIKDWDPKIGEEQYWTYNCKDAVITYEIEEKIWGVAQERAETDLITLDHWLFQQEMFFPVLRMMGRGLRLDTSRRLEYKSKLLLAQDERQHKLNWVVGHEINPRSSKKLLELFYEDLGIAGIQALGTESLSTNSPTLAIIAEREPMLLPLCQLITELRSIGVFLSTFIDAGLDVDGRMRCSFSIAGPVTYRFSSSENAFGSGMNLQNIPVKEKEKIKGGDEYVKLPNIRELFIPDQGYEYFDLDLDRADMQIVGWESGDENLKYALRKGIDLHCMSAAEIFKIKGIPVDELVETHPNYKEHRAKIGKGNRDRTKNGGHACDYGVGDRKLAQTLGISVHEASVFKAHWFALFPGIRKWQIRVEQQVSEKGYLQNPWGARLYNFGRFNLPEFLGWLPQSTVAGVINRALVAIDSAHESGKTPVQLLIQVHDSLAGQYPISSRHDALADLRRLASITIPYEDPLIIPVGIKTSQVSWGHCA